MSNTITKGPNGVALSAIDSDWLWTETYPHHTTGIRIAALAIVSGSGTDTIVVRDGSLTGPVIFSVTLSASQTYMFGGANLCPCIEYTDLTLTAGCIVGFWFGE